MTCVLTAGLLRWDIDSATTRALRGIRPGAHNISLYLVDRDRESLFSRRLRGGRLALPFLCSASARQPGMDAVALALRLTFPGRPRAEIARTAFKLPPERPRLGDRAAAARITDLVRQNRAS
jgi:hypothetical protein